MPLTFLPQYPFFLETEAQTIDLRFQLCVIILLTLLPDIPLSRLEERKSEHIRLLQERISQLKQQMEGDCRPPGNMAEPHVDWNGRALVHITLCGLILHTYSGQLVTGVRGLLGDPCSKTRTVNPSSWPASEKLIFKMLFWWRSGYSLCWAFVINKLNLALCHMVEAFNIV